MKQVIKILLVDDDEDDYFLTGELLRDIPQQHYEIVWASSYDQAVQKIQESKYDVYLIDYRLGHITGIDLINYIVALGDRTPFIILTGKGDVQIDMEAGRLGAADYLVKGEIDSSKLERSIRYAVQRAEASEAIRSNELKFRSLFEQSRDSIFIIRKTGDIIDINQSLVQLFGYQVEELAQMDLGALFYRQSIWEKFMETIARHGSVSDNEVEMKKKDGQIIYCLLTASSQYDNEGNATHYQGILHDITDRKQAELLSRRNEKLDLTGRVARMIAHEVRNPLTNVNLALNQLRNDTDADPESLEFYYDVIGRNCERISILISQLMNSTLPEFLQLKEHSVSSILDESLRLAEDRITLNEIRVIREYTDKPCRVLLDAEKMKIALLNIIINAIEAMTPGQGALKLETSQTADRAYIIVTDNGKGIGKTELKKLFEPFYSGKPEGSGLGLTSAQNIIHNHQGTIDVSSEPGKGTAFIIGFALAGDQN
ncbi:MAG TPA: ATP-binding protein [Anseongella sp.]